MIVSVLGLLASVVGAWFADQNAAPATEFSPFEFARLGIAEPNYLASILPRLPSSRS